MEGRPLKGALFFKMTTKPIAAICQPRIYTNLENWNIDSHFNESSLKKSSTLSVSIQTYRHRFKFFSSFHKFCSFGDDPEGMPLQGVHGTSYL